MGGKTRQMQEPLLTAAMFQAAMELGTFPSLKAAKQNLHMTKKHKITFPKRPLKMHLQPGW